MFEERAAEKEFDIVIESDSKGPFDPEQLSVMCISPRQVYGSGPIFKAIFRHLYTSRANILVVLPHTLEEYNFAVEFNDDSDSDDESLAPKISQRLKKSWLKVNFDSDPEMCRMRKEMEEEGRLEFLDWEECKEKFKTELAAVEQELNTEEKKACDEMAYANAKLFYQKAREKHFPSNPMFQAACLKGEDHVIEKYKKYSLAEIFMGKAWKRARIKQVLYPKTYHADNFGKSPNPPETDLYQCISSTFDDSIRVCNIKVTPHKFVPKPARRKASTDQKITQQDKLITELKLQNRDLQSKVGTLIAHKKKLEQDKFNIQWGHSTDVQALTEAVIEAKKETKQVEEEAIREVASTNTIMEELKSSNQRLESQVSQLVTEIAQMEEELEVYKTHAGDLEIRETALRDEAALIEAKQKDIETQQKKIATQHKDMEAQQKELEEKIAALEKLKRQFLQKKAGVEQQKKEVGEKKGWSAPTFPPDSFWVVPKDSRLPSVQSVHPLAPADTPKAGK